MTQPTESAEGWRAWPMWLRAMLVIMVLVLIAGGMAIATSVPSPSRDIQILGAPEMDFISFVIAYRSQGRLFVPESTNMGQAERICIGVDVIAFGAVAEGTDMIALAQQSFGITLNEVPVPPEDMAFSYDPTIIGIVDSAGQTIGESNGTVSVCFRTGAYPAGDYIGALTILRPDNSTRFYDWAFTIQS